MSVIPAVAFLEMALEALTTRNALVIEQELREFRGLGTRVERLTFPENVSNPEQITDLERGYLIGLEVARVLLETMPAAVFAKVTL